jgi:hypothetical protein
VLTRWVVFFVSALFIAAAGVAMGRSLFSLKSGGACTATPSALCTLPVIAWEGGPQYWAEFSPTNAAGWSNPSFFPVVVFNNPLTAITAPIISNYQAVGVNTLMEIPSTTNMALFRSAGMWALPSIDLTCAVPAGTGSETVGYFIIDEPEFVYGVGSNTWTGACGPRDQTQCGGGANCGFTATATLKANLPNDGHPYGINFSLNVLAPDRSPGMTAPQQSQFINNYANMWVSTDLYWYADTFQCASNGGGAQVLGMPISTALTSDQCHRSSNYGAIIRGIRAILTRLYPVWGFVEAGCVSCDGTTTSITGNQFKGAVWNQIINEARGILIFTPNLAGACTGDVIQLNCGGINSSITTVLGQVSALATVINTQSFKWTFNANIDSMLKFGPDGKWYIFAMQKGFNDTGTYTFTLPTGMTTATTATVLNESRTVSISAGAFSDTFSNEYTYHIYQIVP